jgi:hypothetical protein
MGVLTELVLASIDEADAVAREPVPSRRWTGIDVKGHNSVTFGQLLAILRDVDWTPEIFGDELVASGGDDGPWVTSVPSDFVTEVGALADARLEEIAEAWATTEELEHFSVEQTLDTLTRVRGLCRRAREERATILLWMSL